MSRIGKKPIAIPAGVTVTVSGSQVDVKGPKGSLSLALIDGITAAVEEDNLVFSRADESRPSRANHGLMRSLANNMVVGVTSGFSRRLEVRGIGYRADVKGKKLVMNLGYSHLIEFEIPSDVAIEVDKNNTITVSGIDKARVGQVAANIRGFRPPDRYKGKGVRYEGEHVSLKAGKSA
jgi:large subunit ribosomal protein L6